MPSSQLTGANMKVSNNWLTDINGFADGLPVQKFRIQYVSGVGYRDFAQKTIGKSLWAPWTVSTLCICKHTGLQSP